MKPLITIVTFLFLAFNLHAQNYKGSLKTIEEFNKLSHKPLSNKYGFVKSLKIVYNLKNKKLYYTNSKTYKYHYEFVINYLEYNIPLDNFNKYNYKEQHKNKRFLLANINYYQNLNTYTLELSPADKMSVQDIIFLYNKIKSTSYFKNFKFFLNTSRLVKEKKQLSIPTISANEIYGNQIYQPISLNKSYGKLRFIDIDNLENEKIDKTDIVVVNKPVLRLPIVNGVITTRMQTPLSHISVLGINRKIPVATYKNAYTNPLLKEKNGNYVSFEVKPDTFLIKTISKKKFDRKTKERKRKLKDLDINSKIDQLISGKDLHHKMIDAVGGKAANFGELYKLSLNSNFKVPECSFAIPFYYYLQHIKKHNIDKLIHKTIDDYNTFKNDSLLFINLKKIKKEIKKAPIDSVLIANINKRISSNCNYDRIRFRSSTNAEDIIGFSGAGLYTSKTGVLNDSKKTFAKAIKKVWASLWNKSAFLERELFNINQKTVAMGILAHRSFPNEIANGVAITKNLYRKDFYGNVINIQLGEEPVVNPNKDIVSEQILCYEGADVELYSNKEVIEVITYSSLSKNKLILSEDEILNLSKQLYTIKKYFYKKVYKRRKTFLNFGLDIEFKIDGNNRNLYIKQARYFND
ncbi:PEP/pyruvate-binding domain-containing protein [Tenacibaculum aiptasiae]|uniref:PEP/pyruvate-binding domain-containing protein n=1 Tax=Tenacibaculum aiptasiae TaxID=426481 RepID=UPI003B58C559